MTQLRTVGSAALSPLCFGAMQFGIKDADREAPAHYQHQSFITRQQHTSASVRARVLDFETKDKSAIPLNSVVLRHFVSLRQAAQTSKTANLLILWCPHTAPTHCFYVFLIVHL